MNLTPFSDGHLDVIDPVDMRLVTTMMLGHTLSIRSVAVDGAGYIYAGGGGGWIRKFSPSGALLSERQVPQSYVTDLDVNDAGQLVVGTWSNGHVYLVPTDLSSATLLRTSPTGTSTFVAWSSSYTAGLCTDPAATNPGEPLPCLYPPPPAYCAATALTTSRGWIDSVTVDGDRRETGDNGGYLDATATPTLRLVEGSNVIELEPGIPPNGSRISFNWLIALDTDLDGEFETFATGSGRSTTVNLDVPAEVAGRTTRLRVMMASGSLPAACEDHKYGEVEDYTVTIEP